jgi:hypothetical protein
MMARVTGVPALRRHPRHVIFAVISARLDSME